MGARRDRFDMRMADQAVSRTVNGKSKIAERGRKSARLAELVGKMKFPYTPTLRSWISQAAGKPFAQLDEKAVKALVAKKA
jgi:hypothetical protein